jgi:ACS family tartrate transporter-like MFS transporter
MSDDLVFGKCVRRLLPFMILLYVVNFVDRVNVGFAALTMNKDLGLSPMIYGVGAGIFFAGYSTFQIPANFILERLGARRWIFCILLAWGAISASNAFVQGPTSFYTVRFLLGIAEAGFFPGMVLYQTYWFPKSYRARFVGTFMVAIPFSSTIGGPLSSLILGMEGVAGLHGWQWLFLIEGLPACVIAFAVLKFLPDRPATASWLSDSEKKTVAARLASEDSVEHRSFWLALSDPRVYALGLAYLGYATSYYGVQLWMPLIVQGMGFSTLATGFVVALPFTVTIVAMIWWGHSSDSKGERIWHVALPALVAATAFVIASVAQANLIIFLSLGVIVVCLMSLQGPFWALPPSFLGSTAAAGGIALINTIGTGSGGFLGPALVGALREATGGYALAMAVLALGPLMTAAVVLALGRYRRLAVATG